MRNDGLYANNMNVSYGGTSKFRDGHIDKKGAYHSVHPTGPQRMYFVAQDDGPFWMTAEQKIATKYP